MRKYVVILTFLLLALGCNSDAETVVPVTSTAPSPTITEQTPLPPGQQKLPPLPGEPPIQPGQQNLPALPGEPPMQPGQQNLPLLPGEPPIQPGQQNLPPLPGEPPIQPGQQNLPPLPGEPPIQPGQVMQPGQLIQPPDAVWDGPTICTSHGVFYQPPAFGVAIGQPIADPTATILDDGRIRLYAFAQEIGIVSAVSDNGRMFSEESGVRIPGTEAGQPRVWRLPDGRWRMYVSKVKEIASFTSDDGLNFIKDPGARLTAQAAGLPAISSPSIVEVEPGLWRMYYSTLAVPGTGPGGKRSGSATSTDLLEWKVDPGWRLGEGAAYLTESAEHPFPVVAPDGSVSLFYGKFQASQGSAPDGLWRATSVDGLTFTDEAYTGLYFGNDPEVLMLPNGERIIYYGDFDPAIGGQLLSGTCTEW
ncbi:MAG: hypothetical protein CL751_02610 [Chloroflexi bacterium]|nr:hypothetical protein [Chloroflexota bacterium]